MELYAAVYHSIGNMLHHACWLACKVQSECSLMFQVQRLNVHATLIEECRYGQRLILSNVDFCYRRV